MATAEALRGLGCLGAVEGAVNEEGSNVEGVKEVRWCGDAVGAVM